MTAHPELWFFALFPPPEVAARAAALAAKPAKAEKMHLTLLVPAHPVAPPSLRRAGEGVACAPFEVVLDRIEGGFGDGRVQVLLPDAATRVALQGLHHALREAVVAHGAGLLREDFRPHLTLARGVDVTARSVEPLAWRAADFRLMRSVRAEHRYVTEAQWPLRG